MATTRNPRHGSLQFWPRKKASRPYSRVRHFPKVKDARLLGFAGYKVGMTHALVIDNRPASHTKGNEVFTPVTVVECPPIKVASIRFYKKTPYGLKLVSEFFAKADPELSAKVNLPRKADESKLGEYESKIDDFSEIRVNVYTQPKLARVGKKRPELFELAIGGSVREQFNYAKQALGKDIKVQDILKEGQQVDIYAVTRGKGFQGPVKRFGVTLRPHKSEKGNRGPGNLGPWTGNRSWTVAHAGQMGYHNRMERNKWIIRISEDLNGIRVGGGFPHYGDVKTTYLLLKGSVQGAKKRLVKMICASRKNRILPEHAPQIAYLSLQSKQGA
ncbi:50S ribosomal protein L3 [Candidatus Woesearchaeota archaeon]|nr:50S ribosomal protein L3 [Candidatus Woesearchaeota archaeon]